MRKTYFTAVLIALVVVGWLLSGQTGDDPELKPSLAEQNRERANKQADLIPTKVRVRTIDATEQSREVKVRGKTENKRTVQVKVETAGRIVDRNVERGTRVAEGDLLCAISMEDRQSSLVEAREALNQARIEFQGAQRLKQKGYNSETAIATAKARLAAAQANLDRRTLDIAKTKVRAPFAGIVEDVHQEIGDYVTPGAECATVVDLDPMLLIGRVSEKMVQNVRVGEEAIGVLSDGRRVQGEITFIGQQSDRTTRTYPIEVQVDNASGDLRSGITTEIQIPVEAVMAQLVSPALFNLDDRGDIGIRTIDENNVVQYFPVDVLRDAPDGVWVTGLPNRTTIITVGHQLVVEGERVDPVFEVVMPDNSTAESIEREPGKQPQTAAGSADLADLG
jgi:multidrug efflux system membrane fusion protein